MPDEIFAIIPNQFPPPIALVHQRSKMRPLIGGISGGHVYSSGATLGCLAYKDGIPVIVSNNHVLGNPENCCIGDKTIQPARIDGGTINDAVAEVLEFVPLIETNIVDVAITKLLPEIEMQSGLLDIGKIYGPSTPPNVPKGTPVIMTGGTTYKSRGIVLNNNVTVNRSDGRKFENQIVTNVPANFGDSGSILVTDEQYPRPVGIINSIYTTTSGYRGTFSPIIFAEQLLGIQIATDNYPLPLPAFLTVKTSPLNLGANKFINGNNIGNSSDITVSLEAGTHILSFGDIAGFITPQPITFTVVSNEGKTIEVIYQSLPPECITGEFRCNGNDLEYCNNEKWERIITCNYQCDPIQGCLPPPTGCTEGEVRCNGNDLIQCQNNQWNLIETCQYGCSNGQCNKLQQASLNPLILLVGIGLFYFLSKK